jgi:hypothetical protein
MKGEMGRRRDRRSGGGMESDIVTCRTCLLSLPAHAFSSSVG